MIRRGLVGSIGLSDRAMRQARRAGRVLVVALTAVTGITGPTLAEDAEANIRRSAEQTSFTNAEIADGFFKIAFAAELQVGPRSERIRKFEEAVRIFIDTRRTPEREADVARIVADIRSHVDHLDVAITPDPGTANVKVTLVSRRDFKQTVRSIFGPRRANQIEQRLNPDCLSGLAKDHRYRIRRAEVVLPVDAGEFRFQDCAYEELLQVLGPINDDRSVPWTMFNDDVQMGFFDIYDQYLLNILYDPRIRAGMTKRDVQMLLPHVLPTVRAWVARTNSLQDAAAEADLHPSRRP